MGLNVISCKKLLGFGKDAFHDAACDLKAREGRIVWINGLAKSGTSLVEDIVYRLGFVDGFRSMLRPRLRLPSLSEAVVDERMFALQPRTKKTYLKTHCIFTPIVEEIVKKHDISIILVMRDVRDALVSRFHHICSDPSHWDYDRLHSMPEGERFKASILAINPSYQISQLEYYIFWLHSWLTSSPGRSIFWYEDYLENPASFIRGVAAACRQDACDALNIERKIDEQREKMGFYSSDLRRRRASSGARSGTFRVGKSGQYSHYFDAELCVLFEEFIRHYGLEALYSVD